MRSYLININDQQRQHIVDALRAANLPTDPENDSLHLLLSMFEDMWKVEEDNPGIIHGLCL